MQFRLGLPAKKPSGPSEGGPEGFPESVVSLRASCKTNLPVHLRGDRKVVQKVLFRIGPLEKDLPVRWKGSRKVIQRLVQGGAAV